MSLLRRQIALLIAGFTLGLGISAQFAIAKKDKREPATSQLDEQKRALHALNRLAFGPRPGDVERVARWAWTNGSINNCIPTRSTITLSMRAWNHFAPYA